jgi:hypothetical protein
MNNYYKNAYDFLVHVYTNSMNKAKDEKTKNSEENNEGGDSASVTTTTKQIEWSPENEMIMVEWCDIAQCYKWLNTRAHNKYSRMHAWFTIPAITLSTVSGTASFAQASLPVSYQKFAPMVIGTINIMIGILTTIQQYLKISELNESHRVSAISWDKFARNIRIELAKAPGERMDAGHFLKLNRQEFDRLMETSPSIPLKIIETFNTTFAGKPGSEQRKRFDDLKKPDVCDIIVSANENRHQWYKNINQSFDANDASEEIKLREIMIQTKVDELINKHHDDARRKREIEEKLKVKEKNELQKHLMEATNEIANKIKSEHEKIDVFVNDFEKMHGRKPINEEILNNFQVEMVDDIIHKYLEKYIGGIDMV